MRKMIPQKVFPVFARVWIQAPHVFAQKLIPQEFFPACIGFVPLFTHDLKAIVANPAIMQNERANFLLRPSFSTAISGWEHDFAAILVASRLTPTTLVDSTTHNVSMCFAYKHRWARNLPRCTTNSNDCCECLVPAHRQPDIKRTSAITHINSGQEDQFLLLFCCGMGVATPKLTKRQKQEDLTLLRGKFLQDLGCLLRTLKFTVLTIERWILTFEDFYTERLHKKKNRNFHVGFSAKIPELQQTCHRTRQPTKQAQFTKFCQVVSNENVFLKVRRQFRSKKWRRKWPLRVLGADGKRACVRNSQRSSAKCGNGLTWESAGVGLPQHCGWPETLQVWGGGSWDCFRDGRAIP